MNESEFVKKTDEEIDSEFAKNQPDPGNSGHPSEFTEDMTAEEIDAVAERLQADHPPTKDS